MKKNCKFLMIASLFVACAIEANVHAQDHTYTQTYSVPSNSYAEKSLSIGVVNTKKCLENSKLGKEEQANFEKLKNQMESRLQEKKQALDDIESKLDNSDWIDGASDDAVNKLIRERKTIRMEGEQLQNQYMQTLQQLNLNVVNKLTDFINKASALVAEEGINGQQVQIILSDEACTYFHSKLDFSDKIIAKMDQLYDAEAKNKPSSKSN